MKKLLRELSWMFLATVAVLFVGLTVQAVFTALDAAPGTKLYHIGEVINLFAAFVCGGVISGGAILGLYKLHRYFCPTAGNLARAPYMILAVAVSVLVFAVPPTIIQNTMDREWFEYYFLTTPTAPHIRQAIVRELDHRARMWRAHPDERDRYWANFAGAAEAANKVGFLYPTDPRKFPMWE